MIYVTKGPKKKGVVQASIVCRSSFGQGFSGPFSGWSA